MGYSVELTEEAISYILSLSTKMQAKIQRTINLLKELGYMLPEPHSSFSGTGSLFFDSLK